MALELLPQAVGDGNDACPVKTVVSDSGGELNDPLLANDGPRSQGMSHESVIIQVATNQWLKQHVDDLKKTKMDRSTAFLTVVICSFQVLHGLLAYKLIISSAGFASFAGVTSMGGIALTGWGIRMLHDDKPANARVMITIGSFTTAAAVILALSQHFKSHWVFSMFALVVLPLHLALVLWALFRPSLFPPSPFLQLKQGDLSEEMNCPPPSFSMQMEIEKIRQLTG